MARLARHFAALHRTVTVPTTAAPRPAGHHTHGIITRIDGQWHVNGAPVADYSTALRIAQGRA